jgi:hypothetical protein
MPLDVMAAPQLRWISDAALEGLWFVSGVVGMSGDDVCAALLAVKGLQCR